MPKIKIKLGSKNKNSNLYDILFLYHIIIALLIMKQRQILLTHKNITREFIISNSTKPNTFKNLIKKAFHLQIDVKSFKAADYFKISFEELITSDREGEF